MQNMNRDQIERRLGDDGLAIVEVLGEDAYRRFHIPGAMNAPLSGDFETEIKKAVPNKEHEVVVYCWDKDCDASLRAAEKLESLGYKNVFDYHAGKKDWHRAGMPIESSNGKGR